MWRFSTGNTHKCRLVVLNIAHCFAPKWDTVYFYFVKVLHVLLADYCLARTGEGAKQLYKE